MNGNSNTNGLVKLRNVSFQYSPGEGIYGASINIARGDFVLLVGRTGSGKTTLMKLMSMELQPASGEICLLDLRSSRLKRKHYPEWRRQLGIVYQDLRLLDDRTILDNIKLVASFESRLPGSPKSRAKYILSKVRLSHKSKCYPGSLSLGEQQRVAIARALVNQPYVLLADEPTSSLDSDTAKEVIDILHEINHSGTAVVIATHQPDLFNDCHPRIFSLNDGRLSEN